MYCKCKTKNSIFSYTINEMFQHNPIFKLWIKKNIFEIKTSNNFPINSTCPSNILYLNLTHLKMLKSMYMRIENSHFFHLFIIWIVNKRGGKISTYSQIFVTKNSSLILRNNVYVCVCIYEKNRFIFEWNLNPSSFLST